MFIIKKNGFIILGLMICFYQTAFGWQPQDLTGDVHLFNNGQISIAYKYYQPDADGETILIFYGFGGSIDMMDAFAPCLSHNKVLVVEYPGHGYSPETSWKYSLVQLTSVIDDLLNYLQEKKVNLIGYSLGGPLALNFYQRYPEKISRLILWNTVSFFACNLERRIFFNFVRLSMQIDYYHSVVLIAIPLLKDSFFTSDMMADAQRIIKNHNPAAIINFFDLIIHYNATPVLETVECPVLVIGSRRDMLARYQFIKSMTLKINDAQLFLSKQYGHLSIITGAGAYAGLIADFINSGHFNMQMIQSDVKR